MRYCSLIFTVSVGFCLIICAPALIHELPSYVTPCNRSDPNVGKCLVERTDQVREYLIKGIPELGLVPLEPFHVPEITLEQGTDNLHIKAILKNVNIKGLSTYKFSKFDFNVPTLEWFCEATIGRQLLDGDYDIKGRVLVAQIDNQGKFTASIDESTVKIYQKAELYMKKGMEFLRPINTTTTLTVSSPKVDLQGLENQGDIGNITNKVISDNVNELFQDLKPSIEQVINNIIEHWIIKGLEKNIPYNKLYSV